MAYISCIEFAVTCVAHTTQIVSHICALCVVVLLAVAHSMDLSMDKHATPLVWTTRDSFSSARATCQQLHCATCAGRRPKWPVYLCWRPCSHHQWQGGASRGHWHAAGERHNQPWCIQHDTKWQDRCDVTCSCGHVFGCLCTQPRDYSCCWSRLCICAWHPRRLFSIQRVWKQQALSIPTCMLIMARNGGALVEHAFLACGAGGCDCQRVDGLCPAV